MSPAVLLGLAIGAEVAGTVALRASDGLSKPLPAAIVVVGYATAFWCMSLLLRELSVGFVYAVWSGTGTALVALIGIAAFGESAGALKLASLALVVVGVVGLNLAGGAR